MEIKKKIKQFLDEIEKNNKKGKAINAILEINKNAEKESGKGKLSGKVIAVKSNINVRGMKTSCASRTLENYKAGYDATVIKKIKEEGGIIIGMTNMDEFASGSSGETSYFGPTKNPAAIALIPGGSSSGSAAAVAAGFCDVSLGSDTGGSIRNPASHCDIIGVKPSYGLVSRYGLIDLSMSLDQIGPFAKTVHDAALLLEVIAGHDEKDSTTFNVKIPEYSKQIEKIPKSIKIGISKDFEELCQDKRINKLIEEAIERLCKEYGWQKKSVSLKYVDLAVQTYYPLCYVEFFSATRKFDGRRFGKKIEEVCGPEVLRRILGGSEISRAEFHGLYYRRALKVKELIKRDFEKAFKECDIIICPTVPKLPHKIGSKISAEEMYSYDAFTIPANLSGICALSIPCGKIDDVPVGMQIMASAFQETKMLQVARAFEKLTEK
ncbi:Asp-tRNA(Asn)/Glu-tRNA(Gln) amidotransferase GatCAB subunit A [Candidatus Pacearchaeota archaeon CG06_land_8_20_14_3_00_35_12]|nr:MAG: Asp-tRNA(Asn)/Glu-tRNA(Gln) amidotransferase GatCAB subunit A [Candidatus Pacearchaeota archaeon CG06_land_8_20_14_3_00_35_12]